MSSSSNPTNPSEQIESLFKANGLRTEDFRPMLTSHTNLTALTATFAQLHRAGLLTEETARTMMKAKNIDEMPRALEIMQESGLLAENLFGNYLATMVNSHHPIAVAQTYAIIDNPALARRTIQQALRTETLSVLEKLSAEHPEKFKQVSEALMDERANGIFTQIFSANKAAIEATLIDAHLDSPLLRQTIHKALTQFEQQALPYFKKIDLAHPETSVHPKTFLEKFQQILETISPESHESETKHHTEPSSHHRFFHSDKTGKETDNEHQDDLRPNSPPGS